MADRVAMVSGASRGLGNAVARRMAAAGWRLSLGVRTPERLQESLPGGIDTICCTYDALEQGSAGRWVDQTIERFGRIDAVVNNAGIGLQYALTDDDETALDTLLEVNLKGPLRVTRAALPYLIASGQGRVINVSSLSGKRINHTNVGYAMTKHALMALTHATRRIAWNDGVRATALCPSYIDTDFNDGVTAIAREEMISPDDLAEAVLHLASAPSNFSVAELLVNCRLEDTL
ncbi:SDR family NAD(P)-dependent oxidoreductase [Mesorhizobium sp. Z1-4]|uniref:SDR family NAD(P)-dependent oxidoreductase n=1 Tax=Mesorhizobium sp. Z1-4 TaxID=2448478 RepID=UPI000FD7BE03|nr:SDR family NAD(P)-dependent oxidoreductase [Mesorhizobium sp. Z1-4]